MEARTAYVFDQLELKWEYEPESFMLKNGISYIPDFYLPEIDTWVEVKGVMLEKDKKQIEQFNREGHEILVLMEEKALFFEMDFMQGKKQKAELGHCSECDSFFFCGTIGIYYCRSCSFHNGDHDLIGDLWLTGLEGIEKYVEENI